MVKKGLPHVAYLDVSRELFLETLTRFPSCSGQVMSEPMELTVHPETARWQLSPRHATTC